MRRSSGRVCSKRRARASAVVAVSAFILSGASPLAVIGALESNEELSRDATYRSELKNKYELSEDITVKLGSKNQDLRLKGQSEPSSSQRRYDRRLRARTKTTAATMQRSNNFPLPITTQSEKISQDHQETSTPEAEKFLGNLQLKLHQQVGRSSASVKTEWYGEPGGSWSTGTYSWPSGRIQGGSSNSWSSGRIPGVWNSRWYDSTSGWYVKGSKSAKAVAKTRSKGDSWQDPWTSGGWLPDDWSTGGKPSGWWPDGWKSGGWWSGWSGDTDWWSGNNGAAGTDWWSGNNWAGSNWWSGNSWAGSNWWSGNNWAGTNWWSGNNVKNYKPTSYPTYYPTSETTGEPTTITSDDPTSYPTSSPTLYPTQFPTRNPTLLPTLFPTALDPTLTPTLIPTLTPSAPDPTLSPTQSPTQYPTISPTLYPTLSPIVPTVNPTLNPTITPTVSPTISPTTSPTLSPTVSPTVSPTFSPTITPTVSPTISPNIMPTVSPTLSPTVSPTFSPTLSPFIKPTPTDTCLPSGGSYADRVVVEGGTVNICKGGGSDVIGQVYLNGGNLIMDGKIISGCNANNLPAESGFPASSARSGLSVVGNSDATITGGTISASFPGSSNSYSLNIGEGNSRIKVWGGAFQGDWSVSSVASSGNVIDVHGQTLGLGGNRLVGTLCDGSRIEVYIKDQFGADYTPAAGTLNLLDCSNFPVIVCNSNV